MSGNKNTYLTVALPPASADALAALAGHLAKAAATIPACPSGKVPSFGAMDRDVLHMTFFFAGEQLAGLNADALAAFHAAVAAAATLAGDDARDDVLVFTGLRVFPPGKNNLVVAEYAAPSWLTMLQASVERIAAEHGIITSGSVRRNTAVANVNAMPRWVPHVTLGKIRATRLAVGGVGEALVRQGAMMAKVTPAVLRLGLDGLNVGGFQPRQRWLDWAMPFAPSGRG